MVLIIGARTKYDTDFVPYEISYAVDKCEIPIIATYPGKGVIRNPNALSDLWPAALSSRILNGSAHVIHIPFNRRVIDSAIKQFGPNSLPRSGELGFYNDEAYKQFGML